MCFCLIIKVQNIFHGWYKKLAVNRSLKCPDKEINYPSVAHPLSQIKSLRKNKYCKLIAPLRVFSVLEIFIII